jgi:cell division protein FtsQ
MSARRSGASTAAGRRRTAALPKASPKPKQRRAAASQPPRRARPQTSRPRAGGGAAVALPRLSIPSISIPRPSFGLPSMRAARIALVLVAIMATVYFGWFRHSSLVAAKHVTVEGATTTDASQIVAALTAAGHTESTLDVDVAKLQAAAASFPTVSSVTADAHFPSGLTIHVIPRPPAMIASDGDSQVPIAADGTILTGLELTKDQAANLPILNVKQVHESGRLGGSPLQRALVIGAGPDPLRPLVVSVANDSRTGLTATLKGGIRIEFGSDQRLADKWSAAATVLADPKLHSLGYVDVTIPSRPAVGG